MQNFYVILQVTLNQLLEIELYGIPTKVRTVVCLVTFLQLFLKRFALVMGTAYPGIDEISLKCALWNFKHGLWIFYSSCNVFIQDISGNAILYFL